MPRGNRNGNGRSFTYASVGVDRKKRKFTQSTYAPLLKDLDSTYPSGKPVQLPFGKVYPVSRASEAYYDLQIEGVGTKTLLAELTGKYDTVGIDAVAMAVNDTIRSGAKPLLICNAIHISESRKAQILEIIMGVATGAKLAGCVLASGETGNVSEILHKPIRKFSSSPFDLFVSSLGVVQRDEIIDGIIQAGDVVIGLEGNGIHSNGYTLARRILLRQWGGLYSSSDVPEELEGPIALELLKPTRIYAPALVETAKKIRIKAALHVTGDGLFKFKRLLDYEKNGSAKVGVALDSLGNTPAIFKVIQKSAKKLKMPISTKEMFRTFNMGYGFAVVVSKEEESVAIDSFNRYFPTRRIGTVARNGGKIVVSLASRTKFAL